MIVLQTSRKASVPCYTRIFANANDTTVAAVLDSECFPFPQNSSGALNVDLLEVLRQLLGNVSIGCSAI